MTQQIAEQITHPWVTIITSWLGSGLVGALVAGIYNLRAKQKEYVNDYYKMVIQKRITAYEQLEKMTIIPLKSALADGTSDGLYHVPFSSEEPDDWDRNVISLLVVMSQGLWFSDELWKKLQELNVLLFHFEKPTSVVEFGKKNYQRIAGLRADMERIFAKDMLSLHDVKAFLKSKNKADPGFHVVNLKK
jgi:hypothetical protein